jgi:uncharacterized protein (DUF433 family)
MDLPAKVGVLAVPEPRWFRPTCLKVLPGFHQAALRAPRAKTRLEPWIQAAYIGAMKKGCRQNAGVPMPRREWGRYIVADPAICHGRVTFKGTRVFVDDVLADVERGLSWDFIIQRWGEGRITKEAIAEAVHLARRSWLGEAGRDAVVGRVRKLAKAA